MMDAGYITVCNLENLAEPGDMPKEMLKPVEIMQFEERVVGYNRQYAAKGANEQVDMLVRIWRSPVRIGMYAILSDYDGQECEDGDQYQIQNAQNLLDDDGLKVTDLTLRRVDRLYEVAG